MKKIMLIALLAVVFIAKTAASKSPEGNFGVKYEYFISQGYRLLDSGVITSGISGTTTSEKHYMTFFNDKAPAETKFISCLGYRNDFGKVFCFKI